MSPRVRTVLEDRWKLAGKPEDGWVWPAETKDGHINHDTLKLQHKKALKLAKIRPSRFIQFGTRSLPGWGRAVATCGRLRESPVTRVSVCRSGRFIPQRMRC